VASKTGEAVGEKLSPVLVAQGMPLIAKGQQVGTLFNLRPADAVLDAQAQAFLDQVRSSLLWAGGLAVLLALVLGVVVSQRLAAPVVRLTRAASAIAAGDLTQEVPGHGGDEIGQLGVAFNSMSRSLAQAETLRRNLVADVAHELRTPLTVMQGNLQAILDGVYPLDVEQVASLYDETRLLTRLVDDLRDLALAEAGQLRLDELPVDLAALAQVAVTNFGPAARDAGIELSLELGEEAPQVLGDADRLAQVLRNLLSNALRHTPAGGMVVLQVGRAGGSVAVTVSDTGSGIAPEDLPYVFDRFYRGDKSRSRRGGGAGLGLAIARQLVAAHGGEIGVDSQPGRGTVFTVRLPRLQ
jgi:two-component system OmpR family sensor kinase/two-component system sensor histidine kinase BaeS